MTTRSTATDAPAPKPSWREFLFPLDGRLSQRLYAFWIASLGAIVFGFYLLWWLVLTIGGGALWFTWPAMLLYLCVLLVSLLIHLILTAKRLHDRGRSGWFLLVFLVPIVSFWMVFETLFLRGQEDENEWGPPPRAESRSAFHAAALGLAAIALVFILPLPARSFLLQPFNMPAASIEPTLLVGDYFFVSKSAYGYSRHSFPYSAVPFRGRIFAAEPERGDMVVFKLPSDNRTDYAKRVVGLPGDRIRMQGGTLIINDTPVPKTREGEYVEFWGGQEMRVPQYRETLPNGVSHLVLDREPNGNLDNTEVFVVPEGHYFMLGDNRDNSDDSRAGVGYVPFENLVGKAGLIFFSTNGSARLWEIWKWPAATRMERIGTVVR